MDIRAPLSLLPTKPVATAHASSDNLRMSLNNAPEIDHLWHLVGSRFVYL